MEGLSADVKDKKQVTLTTLNVFYPHVISLCITAVTPRLSPPSGQRLCLTSHSVRPVQPNTEAYLQML